MVRTRDDIAQKVLKRTVALPKTTLSKEKARKIAEMGNAEREDEVREFAMEIYLVKEEEPKDPQVKRKALEREKAKELKKVHPIYNSAEKLKAGLKELNRR